MNADSLKRLDSLVGPLLTRLFSKRRAEDLPAPRSALFIRPGGIGDAVLLVPALRALQAACPGCQIDILAESRNAAVFAFCPGLGAVHRYDSLPGLAAALLGDYDLVVDTEQWYRLSALLARLSRARMLVGFATNERARLFTHPVPYSLEQYEALSFFRLLEPLRIAAPAVVEAPFLTLPGTARRAAEELLAPLSGEPFLTIFPGASVPEKQWGIGNFRALAERLAAGGIRPVIVGGEDTRAAGEEICRGGIALNLAGRASLAVTAALLGQGRVLVSGDSGLLHIAAGLGTPTVSLFGPSDPRKWSPQGAQHVVFSCQADCAPCSRFGTIPPCDSGVRCMDAAPAEVAEAVLRLWEAAVG